MRLLPGAYAPTVTQHTTGESVSSDRYGNPLPGPPVNLARKVLAEYPGNSMETDTAAEDTVLADLVLLVDPSLTVTAQDEWTASDGLRYRTEGQPYRYRHPMTGTAVTQVNLRRIT